jgi:hypothetical protein
VTVGADRDADTNAEAVPLEASAGKRHPTSKTINANEPVKADNLAKADKPDKADRKSKSSKAAKAAAAAAAAPAADAASEDEGDGLEMFAEFADFIPSFDSDGDAAGEDDIVAAAAAEAAPVSSLSEVTSASTRTKRPAPEPPTAPAYEPGPVPPPRPVPASAPADAPRTAPTPALIAAPRAAPALAPASAGRVVGPTTGRVAPAPGRSKTAAAPSKPLSARDKRRAEWKDQNMERALIGQQLAQALQQRREADAARKPSECIFYAQGRCRAGEKCPFTHSGPAAAAEVCKHHIRGNCSKGTQCPFSHDLSRVPCRHFHGLDLSVRAGAGAQGGRCERGDACPFSHAPLSAEQRSEAVAAGRARVTARAEEAGMSGDERAALRRLRREEEVVRAQTAGVAAALGYGVSASPSGSSAAEQEPATTVASAPASMTVPVPVPVPAAEADAAWSGAVSVPLEPVLVDAGTAAGAAEAAAVDAYGGDSYDYYNDDE